MGGGSWSKSSYVDYASKSGRAVDLHTTKLAGDYSAQELFINRSLDEALNIFNKIRECCDSDEHPNTIPVILALDVTGSMGAASVEVAKSLSPIMSRLYENAPDIQFMVMAIGDVAYDRCPLQVSQFEADIRIAEQLDKVYFEGRGGGNSYESYTAAWWYAVNRCKLDCWNRGKKGILITMGDESLNPYIPGGNFTNVVGKMNMQEKMEDIQTKDLYPQVCDKYEVYHISVNSPYSSYGRNAPDIERTWNKTLGERAMVSTIEDLEDTIVNIVLNHVNDEPSAIGVNEPVSEDIPATSGFISW